MITILTKEFEIHCTPLEKVELDNSIVIYLDDVNEIRYKLVFKVHQGLKVTTIDCASYVEYECNDCIKNGIYHRYILENTSSNWIKELRNNLTDNDATFLDKTRHFILPLQDRVIEIIAWDIEIIKI